VACRSCGPQCRPRASRSNSTGKRSLLFIDEIHRFNKAQQDALLPHVEGRHRDLDRRDHREPVVRGQTPRLLSRARVFELEPLAESDLVWLLETARSPTASVDSARSALHADPETLAQIAHGAQGDARRALDCSRPRRGLRLRAARRRSITKA